MYCRWILWYTAEWTSFPRQETDKNWIKSTSIQYKRDGSEVGKETARDRGSHQPKEHMGIFMDTSNICILFAFFYFEILNAKICFAYISCSV